MKTKLLLFCAIISSCVMTMAQEINMRPIGLAEIVVSYELDQLCDYPNQYRAEDWRETGTLRLEMVSPIVMWWKSIIQ